MTPRDTHPLPALQGSTARCFVRRPVLALAILALTFAVRAPAVAQSGLDPAVERLIEELEKNVALAPDSAAAHGELGVAFEANALWARAREAYAEAARLDSSNPDWPLHEAIALRQTGDFLGSLEGFEKIVADSPEYAPAIYRLGLAYLESGDTSKARKAFLDLIQIDRELPEAHAGFGDALLRDGEIELAIQQLEFAVSADPAYGSAQYLLGQAYRAAGRDDEARRHLAFGQGARPRFLPDEVSQRLPAYSVNMTARLEQASRALAEGQTDRAIAILQVVESDYPQNVSVLNNLAVAYMRRGDLEKAGATLDRAVSINREKFSTYLNLSALSHRLQQPEEALRWCDEAVKRAPGVAQVHIARAGALLRLRRTDEAIASFEQALAADHREQEPYLALANLELRRGNAQISESFSKRALGIWPELLPAHFLVFHASLALSNLEQARLALDNVRVLAPDHPAIAEFEKLLTNAEVPSE